MPFPGQLKPAAHTRQVPELPAHEVVVVEKDENPGVQEQRAGCADPPAHTLPAPHPVVKHVDAVATQDVEDMAVDARPTAQLQGIGAAPRQALPAGQGLQTPPARP
jgi:hypothetical protein